MTGLTYAESTTDNAPQDVATCASVNQLRYTAEQACQRMRGLVVSLDRGYPLVRLEDCDAATEGCDSTREVRAQHSTELVKHGEMRAVVGDYVELEQPAGQDTPLIISITPRRTALVRRVMVESIHKGAGRFEEQILAANIDIIFVLTALGKRPLDLDYLERQLVMAHQSGAEVVVVLTKADQAHHRESDLTQALLSAHECPVVVESAVTGEGLEEIARMLACDKTGVLLGRSGVGKSTLINELLGAALLRTNEVRNKDRGGRHTTVARKLINLPSGGAIIDAPGLRSIGLYDAHRGLACAFPEITQAAASCHYRNCTHTNEPDCHVKAAVEAGELSARRLASYRTLYSEVVD